MAIDNAKKRREISKILLGAGFKNLGKGAWLGYQGADIASGLRLNGSSIDTYISTFLLPKFDNLDFINLSLGERLVRYTIGEDTLIRTQKAINDYKSSVWPVKTPSAMITFIKESGNPGAYATWAIYLCHLRNGEFENAINSLSEEKIEHLGSRMRESFDAIHPFVIACDNLNVRNMLEAWRIESARLFRKSDDEFDVFRDDVE